MVATAAGSELGPDEPSGEPRAARFVVAEAAVTEREAPKPELLTYLSFKCIARLTLELSGCRRQSARMTG